MGLAEGCRWIEAKIIEDDEAEMDYLATVLLDRWGDRRTPVNPDWDLANKTA